MSASSSNSDLVMQLGELTPGYLPENVFEAVARLVVTPTFVVIPLFRRGNSTRVVLTRRDVGDTQYAGMLHAPGKILLATDKGLDAVFARLVKTELCGFDIRSAPIFVKHFFDLITRGQEISIVHYLEVADPMEKMLSYDPFALPEDVIQSDVPRIIAAAKAFDQVSN
ncbi:MAG: hypothetical protein ABJY83_08860 [Roseibium sp.]